jgi:hypothetical protein
MKIVDADGEGDYEFDGVAVDDVDGIDLNGNCDFVCCVGLVWDDEYGNYVVAMTAK